MTVFTPAVYVLVPAVATVIAMLLAFLAWHRRPAPGAAPFTAVFLAAAAWSFAYTMELLSTEMGATIFWAKASYLGIVALPAAWLLFALAYSGYREWSSPSTIGLLLIEPVVVTALVWSYPRTELVWTETTPTAFGGLLILDFAYGPVFWIAMAYSYLLLVLGVVLLVRRILRVPVRHQKRVGAILAGAAFPWVGNALFNVGFGPTPPLNLTHLGFAISGVLFFWAFFRYGILDIRHAAHERLFDTIETGVAVLDPDHTVVDINPALAELVGVTRSEAIGRSLDSLLPPESAIFVPEGDRIYNDEVVLEVDSSPRRFDVDLTSVYYPIQQQIMGRIVLVSERSEE